MRTLRRPARGPAVLLVLAALGACSAPPAGAPEPSFRGQPAGYWRERAPEALLSRDDAAREDVLAAIVALAPRDADSARLLAAWLADSDLLIVNQLLDILEWRESVVVPQAVPSLVGLLEVPEDSISARAAALLVRHDLAVSGGEPAFRQALRELPPGPLAPDVLNELAWDLAQDEASEARQHLLALELALAAVRLDGRRSAHMLDTLAWAHWRNGQVEQALAAEEQAVAVADDDRRPRYVETLARFRGAGRP